MFRVDRIEDSGTMHEVLVQLVIGELKTELGMLIQVKQGKLRDTTTTDLALNVDNVFQDDDCDAFDSDVDEAPTTQTMFMANLSSADPVYDEACSSYDSNILSEVHDHDHYQDVFVNIMKYTRCMKMYNQTTLLTHMLIIRDSNMIPYDQYVKGNIVPVVQSNISYVPNDAYMMILNDMHEQPAQHVSVTTQNNVVDKSLTAELATYKEQVKVYERRSIFELTEQEQKIYEQLRIVITDRNIREENLKRELHSVKMQLASTINHNKSMVEEVTSLKKDFKQKENKYLEEFLDMKALKEKVEDKLYKKDQSLQTVHMLFKPSPIMMNRIRKRMNEKMKAPLWTHNKINIRPLDYSKENFLATFTPQTQLTPEQMFWSKDVLKMKTKALVEQAKMAKPVRVLTVYPPNTPAKLVPRVLSTKSQVKINIFALIQLFLEFKKTCKKRITPTGLTEGERGFEQTKECYLTEVIPFFKMLKEHFEGIQKALTIEIKEMKAIFDELEAEVEQDVVNRKSRCLELETELSKLKDKIQKDDHNVMVKHFSDLEDGLDFDSVFEIKKMKASIQGKDNVIRKLRTQISQLQETRCEADRTLDIRALDFQITQLTEKVSVFREQNELFREVHLDYLKHIKESVETLPEIVEEAKVERPLDRSLASTFLYTKHSQELLEYVISTCPKDFNK
nr:hypothetical protein [Tanacetum cinerariifolium]